MDRNEILEKSRQENRGMDLENLEISRDAMKTGWVAAVCIACAVAVLDAMLFKRVANEVFFTVMAGSAIVFFYKYFKRKKKHELFIAVFYGIAAAAFLIAWIVQIAHR